MSDQVTTMPQGLIDFLGEEIICSLAVAMPEGDVHVAPVRCWCDMETLRVYMCTAKNSEKMWWTKEGKATVKAAVAIGLRDKIPFALQMRGTLELFDPQTDPRVVDEYSKLASSLNAIDDPENVMIVFTPSWARYTDRLDNYTTHQITL